VAARRPGDEDDFSHLRQALQDEGEIGDILAKAV
jgi:hypothetical protein